MGKELDDREKGVFLNFGNFSKVDTRLKIRWQFCRNVKMILDVLGKQIGTDFYSDIEIYLFFFNAF